LEKIVLEHPSAYGLDQIAKVLLIDKQLYYFPRFAERLGELSIDLNPDASGVAEYDIDMIGGIKRLIFAGLEQYTGGMDPIRVYGEPAGLKRLQLDSKGSRG
jgi:hypothetical protein